MRAHCLTQAAWAGAWGCPLLTWGCPLLTWGFPLLTWGCPLLTWGSSAAGLGSVRWAASLELLVFSKFCGPCSFPQAARLCFGPGLTPHPGFFFQLSFLNLFLTLRSPVQVSVATRSKACPWPSAGFPNSITLWEIRLFNWTIIRALFTHYRKLGNCWKVDGSKWKVIQDPVTLKELLMKFKNNNNNNLLAVLSLCRSTHRLLLLQGMDLVSHVM